MATTRNWAGGYSRRALLETSAAISGAAVLGGIRGRPARADTPTLNMWWWGEQELPGLQAYVDDSVKSYTAASVKPMLQDTAVVISQFQTAAAAGKPPDIQFLWNGIYHMESVWLGYLQPLNGLVSRRGDHGVEPDPAQPLRRQDLPAGLVRPADDLDLQQGRLR